MKKYIVISVMLGLLAGMGLSFSFNSLTADPKRDEIKIGFINIKRIFKKYQKVKDMQRKLERQAQVESAKIKEIEERAKELRSQIMIYRVGSAIRKRKEKKLTDMLFSIKFKKNKMNYDNREKMRNGLEDIYREVIKVVESYAKRHNFFMILQVSDADFFGTPHAEALKMEIKTRDVLYWGKKYDITNIIIRRMNKIYENKK